MRLIEAEVPALTSYAIDCLIDGPEAGRCCPIGCGHAVVGQREATHAEKSRAHLTGVRVVRFLRCNRCSRRWEGAVR